MAFRTHVLQVQSTHKKVVQSNGNVSLLFPFSHSLPFPLFSFSSVSISPLPLPSSLSERVSAKIYYNEVERKQGVWFSTIKPYAQMATQHSLGRSLTSLLP